MNMATYLVQQVVRVVARDGVVRTEKVNSHVFNVVARVGRENGGAH